MSRTVYDLTHQETRERILDRLASCRGEGTHLVSVYVSKNVQVARGRIRLEISKLSRIKSKQTQKLVSEALSRILDALRFPPAGPLAIFASAQEVYVCCLPQVLAKDDYVCDKSYDISGMRSFSKIKWGLIVLDTEESTIGVWENGRIRVVSHETYLVPRKIAAGGQSAQRFDEKREGTITHMIKDVVQRTNYHLKDETLSKIFVGGVKPTVENFFLHQGITPQLKAIMMPPVPVSYTDRSGLQMLIKKVSGDYKDLFSEYLQEEQKYRGLLPALAKGTAGSLAQYNGMIFKSPPKFYLVQGVDYPQRYCATCLSYDTDVFCDHVTVPVTQVDGAIIFKPGTNADHLKRRYRGVVVFD